MNKVKVIKVDEDYLLFEGNVMLSWEHLQGCCESHYLSLADLSLDDFMDLEFDLTNDNFFERIPDYGIALLPLHGNPVRIPGYGYNNGYYGSNIDLILSVDGKLYKSFDISECQIIDG